MPRKRQDNNSAPDFWGQFLMVGLPGPRLDGEARELVRDLKVGGVVLFARNLEHPVQVWELTRDLQREALAAGGRPLLIALDQEGGTVQRLKAPFTLIPNARELGAQANPQRVEDLARQTARELRLVGVNVNLAPVLDVARGPECPLWDRSYSPDPDQVAALGTAAIRGYLAGGVLPVVKHFPGLGDTVRDSHVELPQAGPGWSPEIDLVPFKQAIAAGVPAVMTAHVRLAGWDDRPATLSPRILQGLLREELGFEGVIITDDLEMGAIAAQAPVPQAARQALAAGADLLLICNNWPAAGETAALLAQDRDLLPPAQKAAPRLHMMINRLNPQAAPLREVRDYFGLL